MADDAWTAGYRHGEELLVRVDGVLATARVRLADLGAVVVGIGPGAFTGLRVGLATAKGLAHGLGIPIVGLPTGAALPRGAGRRRGQSRAARRCSCRPVRRTGSWSIRSGEPRLVPGGEEPELDPAWTIVAVDLRGGHPTTPSPAGERGARRARRGARPDRRRAAPAAASVDDLATLVPEYVTLPRGVREEVGAVAWSRDPR